MIIGQVIVRAFGGKPLQRVGVQSANGLVYVVRPGAEEQIESGGAFPVGFPEADIFEFREESFDALDCEWRAGATTQRASWSALTRFRPAPAWPERKL